MREVWFRFGIVSACTCLLLSWPSLSAAEGAMPSLSLRVATGQNTFHIGERIPVELSFSSSEDNRYELTMASYDRSGRMNFEDFVVSPKIGWADPLGSYFANRSGLGGGYVVSRLSLPSPSSYR